VITQDWLSVWWQPLIKGGWHAPIVMVNNQVISQGVALNRGLFIEKVITTAVKNTSIQGNHVFGKTNCPFCQKAKVLLDQENITYEFHDVIKAPKALYEMIARVKPIIGEKTPITVPQIWLEGVYIGGHDALVANLTNNAR